MYKVEVWPLALRAAHIARWSGGGEIASFMVANAQCFNARPRLNAGNTLTG
jgi:hypothetical protein